MNEKSNERGGEKNDEEKNNELLNLNEQLNKVTKELVEVNKEYPQTIQDLEKNINADYKNRPIMAIFVEDITEAQLPKLKIQPSQLKSISERAYEDPE